MTKIKNINMLLNINSKVIEDPDKIIETVEYIKRRLEEKGIIKNVTINNVTVDMFGHGDD